MLCPITFGKCDIEISVKVEQYFLALPYKKKYEDIEKTVASTLEQYKYLKKEAKDEAEPRHIFCKICQKIQECSFGIFEISEYNPNVMLELGTMYGMEKMVILLKNVDAEKIPSDLGGIEYVPYENMDELKKGLKKYISALSRYTNELAKKIGTPPPEELRKEWIIEDIRKPKKGEMWQSYAKAASKLYNEYSNKKDVKIIVGHKVEVPFFEMEMSFEKEDTILKMMGEEKEKIAAILFEKYGIYFTDKRYHDSFVFETPQGKITCNSGKDIGGDVALVVEIEPINPTNLELIRLFGKKYYKCDYVELHFDTKLDIISLAQIIREQNGRIEALSSKKVIALVENWENVQIKSFRIELEDKEDFSIVKFTSFDKEYHEFLEEKVEVLPFIPLVMFGRVLSKPQTERKRSKKKID